MTIRTMLPACNTPFESSPCCDWNLSTCVDSHDLPPRPEPHANAFAVRRLHSPVQTSLVFSVGEKEIPNLRMVERHYFRNKVCAIGRPTPTQGLNEKKTPSEGEGIAFSIIRSLRSRHSILLEEWIYPWRFRPPYPIFLSTLQSKDNERCM